MAYCHCIVENCDTISSARNKAKNISFHRFPVNKERRQIWLDNLNLQPHVVDTHVVVCSLHFRSEDIFRKYIRPRYKYFLVPDAVPLKWADDPRNIPRKYEKVDPEYGTHEEIEINVKTEQISYENDAVVLFKPQIQPDTTRTFTFIEVPHATEEVSLENTHNEQIVVKNEPMLIEISNTDEMQLNIDGNEAAPGTTQMLWELRKKNQVNMKMQKTILHLRKKVKCLQQQLRRRNKKLADLKAKMKKCKCKKNPEKNSPMSPQSAELSREESEDMVEVEELEELDDDAVWW
ncbi:uncharacterized protein LOC129805393 isoform X2 [Phlebotomus papatasi]|uniref:uncharacterized protein LOC129805393 isoform X2 n=1 Tax=Phlebotomus papatasi TaxID=29031 RepID=UPI00248358A3|nr:uncharacterized protein LOC129805393 isoform X2 [Phlebotomus papatasi]